MDPQNAEVSCGTVFQTPELLDNILSFLDIQDLLQAREVSPPWRAVADWSLKRRLYARHEQRWEESETSYHLDFRKLQLHRQVATPPTAPPPEPIPSDVGSEVFIHIGPAPPTRPGKSKRYPVVLATLLKFDWCTGIQELSLSGRTVSVQEWNLIGRWLLNRLRSLRCLELVLWSVDGELSSAWEDVDLMSTSEVECNSGVEFLEIQYVQQQLVQKAEESEPAAQPLLDLGFLEVCPKVLSLNLQFLSDGKELRKGGPRCSLNCSFSEVEGAGRNVVECKVEFHGSQSTIVSWMDELDSHLSILKPSSLVFETDQLDYVARLPEAATSNLSKLKVGMNLVESSTFNGQDLLRSLDRNPSLRSLKELDLSIWSGTAFDDDSEVDFPLLKGILNEPNMRFESALRNVKRLNLERLKLPCCCSSPSPLEDTFQMWSLAPKLMPNVQLLLVHQQCLCFLESITEFPELRHLVILNSVLWHFMMPSPPHGVVWRKFKSLHSITAQFKLWTGQDRDETLTVHRQLVREMAQAPSLKLMQICHPSRATATMAEMDVEIAALVPTHVQVSILLPGHIRPYLITLDAMDKLTALS